MKYAICAALMVCAVAVAEEPQPAVPAPAEQPAKPATEQPDSPWMLGDLPKQLQKWLSESPALLPDGSLRYSDGRVVKPDSQRLLLLVQDPNAICYYIRTLRPVLPDEDAQRSGLIPLQSHVLGTVREPTCTNGGMLHPMTPVRLVLLKSGQ